MDPKYFRLSQIFEIEDWLNISSLTTSCRVQWRLFFFFLLFSTLPLMCVLWRDAFLHYWEVPVTNLAKSDCRRPFSASVPTFITEEFPSLSSTAQKFVINYCSFNTALKGLDCYKFSFSADIHSSLLKEPCISPSMLLNKNT